MMSRAPRCWPTSSALARPSFSTTASASTGVGSPASGSIISGRLGMAFPNRIFRIWVAGKPPIKRRPRGRTHYTPKATRDDEQRVQRAFADQYLDAPYHSTARFSVELRIYTNRNVDGDNIEKAILDALNSVLWENDR